MLKAKKAEHQARQRLYDAIKAGRAGETTAVDIDGQTYLVGGVDRLPHSGELVLVKFGSRVEVCKFADKDGFQAICTRDQRSRFVREKDILAIVKREGENDEEVGL